MSVWTHDRGRTLSSHSLACERKQRLFQATFVASGCSPPRTLRNFRCSRPRNVKDRVAQGCRASKGGLRTIPVMVDLASFRPFAADCKVPVIQLPIVSAAVRASRRNPWDKLCLATFSSRQKHRWHYQLYTDCMGLHHRTIRVSYWIKLMVHSGYTFDFFNRQRSHALHTRFLILSWASIESDL